MQKILRLIVASVALSYLSCGEDGPTGSPPVKGVVQSNGGNYSVKFQTSPDPIPMNESFTITFSVAQKAASKGESLAVEVDVRMPAHGHGMNKTPKLTRGVDGSYRAEGMLFHMPGHWELYFDISEGGKTERAQVDVDLK